MHHLQCEFSRRLNRRSGRTSGLWQSRYQAKLVDEQRHLTQLVLYIHFNPVRAGAVENLTDHVFAGHPEMVKRVKNPVLDVETARLASRARERSTAEMRRMVTTLGVERWGQKGRQGAGDEIVFMTRGGLCSTPQLLRAWHRCDADDSPT